MESAERVMTSPELPADADVSQSVGESPINPPRSQSHRHGTRDQMQPGLETDSSELGQHGGQHLHLAFQDSNLSPALSLLPVNSRPEHTVTEFSFFQHTDTEFAPLRPYPDVSMATERFHTTQASEQESLSQHPLAQATLLTEEGASSFSLSQHSSSPGDHSKRGEKSLTPAISSKDNAGRSEGNPESCQDIHLEAAKDETFFLRKDVSAKRFLDILPKDIGVQSSTSNAISSASKMSIKSSASFTEEYKSVKREGPSGKACSPPQRTQQSDRVSNPGQSEALSSEVCNITTGSRSTQPDEHSETLHRELLSEVERCSGCKDESQNTKQNASKAPFQAVTPNLNESTDDKTTGVQINVGGLPSNGPFSAGVGRIQREHDLWSSGNQTGIDGSYLGFLPHSQSTPGIFKAPPKSSVKTKIGKLSAIESSKDNSYQSSLGICRQPVVPSPEPRHPDTSNHQQQTTSAAEVQSLPSLNYMQKVDAWRANQSSAKTSLFDSLALQGFSGISPKKKAYDAVSDSLNRILSQQAKSLQQPFSTSAPTQSVPQSSSTAPSGSSSPRRGETVGSAPSEKDTTSASAAPPSSSPFGRSQSQSSLNTVKSANIEQQTEQQKSRTEENAGHDSTGSFLRPSTLSSLGHFSDVSLDQDWTLSSSQGSYSGVKKHTSIGASSVVSLEIDNYAPYWNSKRSTPPLLPKPRELNIDERIPLYLHNLGIDQSPSTILNPFALRGPIREAEFSPTDLCTLKGSTGTPARSIQASEVGSPQKGEFSRTSIHSVDSSLSISLSMDSLGAAVSLPEQARRASPPPETDALHSDRRLPPGSKPGSKPGSQPGSQPDKDSRLSLLRPGQQVQSSQTVHLPGERVDSPFSVGIKVSCGNTNFESLLQTSHSTGEAAEYSFVSTKSCSENRELLSHAENMRSTGSSASSSAPPAAHQLLSDEGSSLSPKNKSNRLQDSSFSSAFTSGEPKTPSSLQWTRSSSESLLSFDQLRQLSVGEDRTSSSWQPDYTSTQTPVTAPSIAAHKTPQDSAARADAGTNVLSKSFRRTEPEGCSAAPPDNAPPQPLVIKPPPDVSVQQPTSPPADTAEVAEVEEATPPSPAQSSSSSPVVEGADHYGMSDGSSESSLAVRVAKLLQRESPSTMMSSKPSTTDHEEHKAREWIKLRVSGRPCEPLELNKEDIKWIELFKRELNSKNPMPSQESSDVESSSTSSVGESKQPSVVQLAALSDASTQPTRSLEGPRTNPADSIAQTQPSTQPDLEAQVCEIAAREGVILPSRKPRALTSITIATHRRSTSPSPSSSPAPPRSPAPEPLHLLDLSTGADRHVAAGRQLDSGEKDRVASAQAETREQPECESDSLNSTTSQRRGSTMGARFEEAPRPSQPFEVTVQLDGSQQQNEGNPSVESSSKDHISHVRLTLSPKVPDHTPAAAAHSSHPPATSQRPHEEFVPLRQSSPPASSPDEGVGLSSPLGWCDGRDPARQRAPGRSNTSTLLEAADTPTEFFTARHRTEISSRRLHAETRAPVLLPYKPHGSEELFYVPRVEADRSSAEPSDTTMESSHPGSDDAVPPRFNIEVLGQQEPGVDRGVTIRHAEGIYSKRLKTATFKMQDLKHRDAPEASDKSSPTDPSPKPSNQVSVAFTKVSLPRDRDALKRDQGTSPIPSLSDEQAGLSRDRLKPAAVVQSPVRHTGRDRKQLAADAELLQQSSLDQLWKRFCHQWTVEQQHQRSEGESPPSRLTHSRRSVHVPEAWEEKGRRREELALRRRERREDFREVRRSVHGGRRAESPIHHEEESSSPADDDGRSSVSSDLLHSSPDSRRVSTADASSSPSSSLSTVDTARLVQVFGENKVQQLKRNSSLSKLYSAINRQREEGDHRRKRSSRSSRIRPPVTAWTEESLVADSTSSTSPHSVPSPCGPSRMLAAKKTVKMINKGIQAGDIEIIPNATCQNTRDVGTMFPSPGDRRGRGGPRSSPRGHSLYKQRKSRTSPSKPIPAAVSWFIPASSLKSSARKENQPEEGEESEAWRPSVSWFQPYSRAKPWRRPLQPVQEEGNEEPRFSRHAVEEPDPRSKTSSSGRRRISLQEALEIHRPDFIDQSRQRVRCLARQAEERKLQAAFSRDEMFNRLGGAERLPRPAGTALLRAVPRKEMIQRSKLIYQSLPEVQRRREEERRKVEYRSYRQNAQLYNQRIRNRVLGRRSAWQ